MKKLIIALFLTGCGGTITQQDRADVYRIFAVEHRFKCAAYHFDLSANLTYEVPEMTKACQETCK